MIWIILSVIGAVILFLVLAEGFHLKCWWGAHDFHMRWRQKDGAMRPQWYCPYCDKTEELDKNAD